MTATARTGSPAMLETAVALALGHFLADFILQSDAMVRDKAGPRSCSLHVLIVAAASWARSASQSCPCCSCC